MLEKTLHIQQLSENKEHLVRLTQDGQKVIKVEIYVDQKQRCEIFKYFPDKTLNPKETAPHFLLLKSLASYQKKNLTANKSKKEKGKLNSDRVASYIKDLCHKTAPLYALVNHPHFDHPFHPLHHQWKKFRNEKIDSHLNEIQLKILFFKEILEAYQREVNQFINDSSLSIDGIKKFQKFHNNETQKLISQLNTLENQAIDEEQLRKIFSNQDETNTFNICSLGEFLRSQAEELAQNGLNILNELTEARFDQLFSFSAHPLHKELVLAKKALSDLRSTHAARFLNTQSPVPIAQLAVLENDNTENSEKKWMDIMPYVNCKAFLGEGIEGVEGLNDVDAILSVYLHGPLSLKKSHSIFYEMLMGKKGTLGILTMILLGLPGLIVAAAVLVIAASLAMAVDFAALAVEIVGFALLSPIILFGLVADFCLQIPSFFTENAEIKFSFLAKLKTWPIPPQWLQEKMRRASLVRMLKQSIFDSHAYYKTSTPSNELNDQKSACLEAIKKDQAEGLLNVVACKFFSFPTIAGFFEEKLRQIVYAMREFRKVLNLMGEVIFHFISCSKKRIQEVQRKQVVDGLLEKIKRKNDEIVEAFESAIRNPQNNKVELAEIANTSPKWPNITPWTSRHSENPLDFISEVGQGAVATVDFAFTTDPGIATPMFLLSILSLGAMLFPAVATVIPLPLVNGLQWLPQYVAKAFMGKSLEAGLPGIASHIISVFLQWQLTTYGTKGLIEIYHGNFEWVKKLFEHPEEITLGAGTFIAMGYVVGLIQAFPTDITRVLKTSDDPFLKAVGTYLDGIYQGFANVANVIIDESKEVVTHGASGLNTLELGFIGFKSFLFIYGFLSGAHQTEFTPLNLNIQKLCKDYQQGSKKEKLNIILDVLRAHGITDPHSTLAKKIIATFDALSHADEKKNIEISTNVWSRLPEETAFINAREELEKLLQCVSDMEVLGIPIDLDLDKESKSPGYQSRVHAELMYDALFFAVEDYNQAARRLGLFHQQIEGSRFLHNFYNKHCYTGSSGWHKFLFGILLLPFTWLWRGIKYALGTPSMRHQVKKSFCKDFAMFFQLIPDVIAPIIRAFIKATLYSVRMLMGILVLPLLTIALVAKISIFAFGFLGILPASMFAVVQGAQKNGAETFASVMKAYFFGVKKLTDKIWSLLLCNPFVNDYLKIISLFGSTSGTGSPHRLNLLKSVGAAAVYEYLTSIADTSSENLQMSTCDLSAKLAKKSAQQLLEGRAAKQKIFDALLEYKTEADTSWKWVSRERPEQLARVAESALNGFDTQSSPVFKSVRADESSRLNQKLKNCGFFSATQSENNISFQST